MPRKSGKAKQTRLTFTPVEPSSPAVERSPGSSPFRPAKLRYSHPSNRIIRKGQLQLDDFAGNRTFGDEEQKPSKRFSTSSTLNLTSEPSSSPSHPAIARHIEVPSSSDEDIVQASARRRRHNVAVISSDQQDSDEHKDSNHDSTMPRTGSSRQLRPRQIRHRDNDESSDRDVIPRTTSTTQKQTKAEMPLTPAERRRQRPAAADMSRLGSAETSDADELVTRPTSRKRRAAEPKKIFVVDDDDEDSEDSDDVVLSSPAKRRRRQTSQEPLRTPQFTSKQDKLDLEEDLLDLQDSAVKKTRTRGRLANSAKSQRQKHLEILRRRRAGEKEQDDIESEEDDDEDDEEISSTESGIRFQREDSSAPADFSRNNQTDSDVESAVSDNEDLDQYEKDFVEEDEGELGVPADMAGVPFEYTRHSYKQPRECFRDVVEWMVHNKLNPAFSRNDDMYQSAFRKLENEVHGRAGSQLMSSVWNVNFRYALLARPQIDIVPFPTSANHSCDACNRSGHPASSDIRLYGKPYYLETLEPLSDTDESDEEDEESSQQADGQDRDRDGHVLPDEDTRFFLGRHCKANAAMTHTLVHWRYHLNEWVIGYLEDKGIFEAHRIVEREKWSQKKKSKYANETVDMMDEKGEVQRLWRDFHITLKAARETKESRW